jgi:hypothetical protein
MHNGTAISAWKKFAAFEVFGDYRPMSGFRLLVKLEAQRDALEELLEHRANECELLDPELASAVIRAGLGLIQSGLVSFAYATSEAAVVLIRSEAMRSGTPLQIHNNLLGMFTARLSLLLGGELATSAGIFEFPDLQIVRRAFSALAEDVEETTPLRSSQWLGAQLRGRGQPFHPSMVETLEEQTSLLQSNGIDMDALPPWWWRGIAAHVKPDGEIEVFDDLPAGEDFGRLIPD